MRYLYVIMLLVVLLFLSYHNSDTTHYSYPTHSAAPVATHSAAPVATHSAAPVATHSAAPVATHNEGSR